MHESKIKINGTIYHQPYVDDIVVVARTKENLIKGIN